MPAKRNLLLAAAALAALALLVRANYKQMAAKAGTGGPAPVVRVMPVGRGQLIDRVVAPASLSAARETELRAPFAAPVARLQVKAGDKVGEGQPLALLDTADLENEIRRQEAQLIQARDSLAQAQVQARLAPLEAQQRRAAAERAVTRARTALADARRAAEQSVAGAEAAVAVAEAKLAQALAAARASSDAAGLAGARAAAQAAFEALAGAPENPQKVEAYRQAQAAYQDLAARSAEQAAGRAAGVAAAEQALVEARQAVERARVEGEQRVEQAELDLAQREYEQEKLMLEQGTGASLTQLQGAEQAVRAAEDALRSLRAKVAEATIRSPLTGVVLATRISDGQAVTAGTALVTVGVTETMAVNLRVDESDIAKVQLGQALTLRTPAFPGQPFPGQITDVPVAAGDRNNQGGMPGAGAGFLLTAEVRNEGGRLRVGMNAEAEIVAASRAGVILVGLETVRQEGGRQVVYVLDGDVARARPVQTGARSRTQVEVLDGLKDGDLLIAGPFATVKNLQDGQKVKVEGPPGGPGGPGGKGVMGVPAGPGIMGPVPTVIIGEKIRK